MDIQEYLRPFQGHWQPAFLERARALPEDLQQGLAVSFSPRPTESPDHQSLLSQRSPQAFRALIPTLAGVFFPQFPEVAARTLEALLTRHAYPLGHARRAFRAPDHALQVRRAANWLNVVWTLTRAFPAQSLEWFAVHAGLLPSWQAYQLGLLFAQAIDDGDTQVFGVLRDTASSQHPLARMGRHVPSALLASRSEAAHALAEGLLLAARRQEGLRQVILESVDEAGVEAFTRLLDVILREDLLRFAATLRAACVWFGLDHDVTDLKAVKGLLGQALAYLRDGDQARQALASGGGEAAYLALYTLGMRDAPAAAGLARPLLRDPDAGRRMAAAQFLLAAELLDEADAALLLADPDPRLGALVASSVNRWTTGSHVQFADLVAYAGRLGRAASRQPLLFPWLGHIPGQAEVLDSLPGVLGGRPLADLAPHLGGMSAYGKAHVLSLLSKQAEAKGPGLDAAARAMLRSLLQDRNSDVSQKAVEVMAQLDPEPAEVQLAHGLLKRTSADLRRGLIRLLARDRAQGLASARQLLAAGHTGQRQAGLQLLLELRAPPPADFQPKTLNEQTLFAALTRPASQLTLEDGLGLFDPAQLACWAPLRVHERDRPADLQRGAELLTSLDALIVANRETPLTGLGYDGAQTHLLMNISPWWLRWDEATPMPLHELWEGWWQGRPDAQDGDLTRLSWALHHHLNRAGTSDAELDAELDAGTQLWQALAGQTGPVADPGEAQTAADIQGLVRRTLHQTLGPPVTLRLDHADLAERVVAYLLDRHRTATDTQLALDAWESALARLPQDAEVLGDPHSPWRQLDPRDLLLPLKPCGPVQQLTPEQFRQFWNTDLTENRAFPRLPRRHPGTDVLLWAYDAGLASRADLLDQLLGPRTERPGSASAHDFGDLRDFTRRTLREDQTAHPDWLAAVGEARDRVLEVELQRGDLDTPASLPAQALQSVHGAALALRLLAAMGQQPLKRGYHWNNTSRDATFSHLLRVSFPLAGDTAAVFGAQARALGLPDARLLDLAMYAPQWARLVSDTLGWPGLADGVYWLHAHTRDSNWSVPQEVRDAWEAEIGERTPLKASDLTEGAVDVAWFHRMHGELGEARFRTLLAAARYASSSGGHKRAELFASAILGDIAEPELLSRIAHRRSQDAVRALGLLPLAAGAARAHEVEARYLLLARFRREARQFGAQRQASERLAADIGLQNLARSAGYSDPQRLMWAMEARVAPDWQQQVTLDGVTVRAVVDGSGEAALQVARGDRLLKTLPPALKKHPEVVALRDAVRALEATRSRMRAALEDAMVRGDHFSGPELADLSRHPVIAPMLRALVWVLNERQLGFWQGDTLDTLTGPQAIGDQALRVAHPHDLFTHGQWRGYQARLLERELGQPFKQVFREYYPLTPAEQDARRSTRYQGHHVQPQRAAALLKSRGWVSVREEGTRKTYHQEGINVWIDDTLADGTPGEVEGMPLHAACFVRRDETQPMPLAQVPPRLFSETMRDLDLVVSVAHVGGVDPEASHSTVEMRASLLRETLRLLKLENVRLEHDHALIDGAYSQYSVHLGSGTVHRQPGGFLCIIPVHNAHSGRLFLPFADPDPRTAEVVSKVLLLAEDRKIADPTILEQLR